MSLPDPVQLAVPAFVALLLLEVVVGAATGRARYEPRDTAVSLLMGVGNLVTGMTLGLAGSAALLAAWRLAPLDLGTGWPVVVIGFVLDDLRYYVWHRLAHEHRWFWADHVVHHSSRHYNLSTALRQPWTDVFTGAFLLRVPLVLAGFHPALLAFTGGLNLVYQFWIHTETIRRLPAPIEALFNTPSHHRVHHATNPPYLDANYGGTLIVWDRLFGTFVPERDDEPCRYGTVHEPGTFNPLRIAFHEWVGMARDVLRPGLAIRQRWGYLWGPPGWSHDGSRATTVERKRRWLARAGRAS